jgi:hypothetical protein
MRMRLVLIGALLSLPAAPAAAITFTPFTPTGAGGTLNGQTFTVGAGGDVFELDAFVNVGGADLNGAGAGTSARLSTDALPAGLALSFSSTLLDGDTDVLLAYEITNTGSADVSGLTFFSFLDAEITEPTTTFFNEFATTTGALAAGQSFEVDEPGYASGNLVPNLLAGALDGTNALPLGSPDDVAMAFGFSLGVIPVGATGRYEILISEDGDAIGSFAIAQYDSQTPSAATVTYSGRASLYSPAVPEPSAVLLYAAGFGVVATYLGRSARSRPGPARRE